jgi:transcriptional regulator with XRE-family HTH domain
MAKPSSRAPKSISSKAAAPLGKFSAEQLKAIDASVGEQVRTRRFMLGMSQQSVAKTMGLTFQQLQKYEHGTNRISASRLYQLARILMIPVSRLFDAVDVGDGGEPVPETPAGAAEDVPPEFIRKRRTVELVRAFYALQDDPRRNAALKLLQAMGPAPAAAGSVVPPKKRGRPPKAGGLSK